MKRAGGLQLLLAAAAHPGYLLSEDALEDSDDEYRQDEEEAEDAEKEEEEDNCNDEEVKGVATIGALEVLKMSQMSQVSFCGTVLSDHASTAHLCCLVLACAMQVSMLLLLLRAQPASEAKSMQDMMCCQASWV